MKKMNSLIAGLALAAITVAVPAANAAATKKVAKKAVVPAIAAPANVHYVGVGSTAMFNGFAVAAYNDLGPAALTACEAGGDTCTLSHWSNKTTSGAAWCNDTRTNSSGDTPADQYANVWVVWVEDVTNPKVTDLWAYLATDSTVGNRCYLAGDTLNFAALAADNPPANVVAKGNFLAGQADVNLTAQALAAVNGVTFTAGMTDIRPEDALQATYRILGGEPNYNLTIDPGNNLPGDTYPTTLAPYGSPNWDIYSFALGYSSYNVAGTEKANGIGAPIESGEPGSTAYAQPVIFALPGTADPPNPSYTPPATIQVFPVGESPIIFMANRSNTTTGLGQVIGSHAAGQGNCYGSGLTVCQPDNTGQPSSYTSDGSYYVRNLWDQHPWPSVAGTYPSLTFPSAGVCANATNQTYPECHVTRRPLGNLFSSGDCEGDNSAFTWPLSAQTQGLRAQVPNRQVFPITLFLREPLSGTYNTTEYTEIRRYGQGGSGQGLVPPASPETYERPPYVSQETNIVLSGTDDNPTPNGLFQSCPSDFGEAFAEPPNDVINPTTEGTRIRGIGNGEVTNGNANVANNGVLNTPDSITYGFFSFGNVSKMSGQPPAGSSTLVEKYGYLMIDGIDPLFADYENNAGEPGQPASPSAPLSWGVMPYCTPGGSSGPPVVPDCKANTIWLTTTAANATATCPTGTVCTYPHIRDGSYPAWSEVRMMCDTASAHCPVGSDANGAEALVEHLQADIHNNATGGIPDLLPFSDAASGPLSFNPPYGDASFIRDHYAFVEANDTDLHDGGTITGDFPDTATTTTHQSNVQVTFTCNGGVPKDGPAPVNECGGDAGGLIVPVGTVAAGGSLQ